jgi:hypothetical protein
MSLSLLKLNFLYANRSIGGRPIIAEQWLQSGFLLWRCESDDQDAVNIFLQVNSSIGRAPVSKTDGWEFETLLACHFLWCS